MKTFPHWRAVGRAMLDVRRRKGITGPKTSVENPGQPSLIELRWDHEDGRAVEISWRAGEPSVWVDVKRKPRRGTPVNMAGLIDIEDARQVLRVLAALDLIPAELAEARDERYGRCLKCDRIAEWVPPTAQFSGRWCHLRPERPFHIPVVPEVQPQGQATGDQPTDLAEAGPAAAPTQEHDA